MLLQPQESYSADANKILEWQKTRSPQVFVDLMSRYQPVVHSVVNRYKTTGVAPATLRAHAQAQLMKSFDSYNPDMGTQPSTYVWNNLQKVQRLASESLTSGHIPEYRNLKRATFTTVRDNLTDRLGYEPSVDEMADELGWSKKEVGRMNNELGGEVTASGAEFDFYGNSTSKQSTDKPLVDYLYHELEGKNKVIFEHTFGYGGKPILTNKEIAKKLRTNEMAIHRAKKAMGEKIQSYR